MLWIKVAAKTVLLGALSCGVAAAVGAGGVQESYFLALLVSVMLCPALLGFIGGRWLRLGVATTLVGINLLPFVMALDARFHLGEPVGFGWLALSALFAWGGWYLAKRLK